MQTDFDVQQWTRQHAEAFRAEILEVAGAALNSVDVTIHPGKVARVLVRPRGSKEPWRPLDRLALALLAAAVSRDIGRTIGPRHLKKMLEHMATGMLLMTPEQFWSKDT